MKDQDPNQTAPSCSVQSQIRNQNIAIDYDNPRNSKHLLAGFRADRSSPTPNTNHQNEGSSMNPIHPNTLEQRPFHPPGPQNDHSKVHEQLDDDFGPQDPGKSFSTHTNFRSFYPLEIPLTQFGSILLFYSQ